MPHHTNLNAILGALAAASLLAGCSRSSGGDSSQPEPAPVAPAKAGPAQPAQPAKQAPAAPPATPAPASPGAMGPDGLPAEIPATRSPVPTVAEWAAVTREISVRRSSPLGCETKMLREWLRVSCRGKNDVGGTPLAVKALGGCTSDTYTFGSGGITSLVTPILRGRSCDASFSWSHGGALLNIKWPSGAPRPTIAFQG